jgi:hypothetical protein
MRKGLEQRLVEPTRFNTAGDIRQTLVFRGFTDDDRWFDILWRVRGLRTIGHGNGAGRRAPVRSTAGEGEIRWVALLCEACERRHSRILAATQKSFHTCEVCGGTGNTAGR